MKSISKIICLLLCINVHAFADESFFGATSLSGTQRGDVSIYGALDVRRVQFENLVLMGNLDYQKLKVTDTLTVNGNIEGVDLDVDKLVLNGFLSGSKMIIRNGATINGGMKVEHFDIHGYFTINTMEDALFKAKKSNFEKISVASRKVEFNEVIAESIEFAAGHKEPELYLKNASFIKGNIIFKSGQGIIYKSKNSKIKGKVRGGKIVDL